MTRLTHVAVFAALLLCGSTFARSADAPIAVTKLLSATETASGQPITFPQGPGRVIVSEYVIQPGTALPLHEHPYQRIAYVLQGLLDVRDEDTGQTFSYKPGDVVVEVVRQRHLGVAKGSEPVRLIVFDTTPAEVESNTLIRK